MKQFTVSTGKSVFNSNMSISTLNDVINQIKSDLSLVEKVKAIRIEENKDEAKNLKSKLPFFNLGLFKDNIRKNSNFLSTEFMIVDIDELSEVELDQLKIQLQQDGKVFCYFTSPSGNGIKIVYHFVESITDAKLFSENYKYYSNLVENEFGITTDKTNDAARACFFSSDPDIYLNENAETLEVKQFIETISFASEKNNNSVLNLADVKNDDEQFIPNAVEHLRTRINNYDDWTRAGMALASLGERGRNYFHELSSNPSYNDTPAEVDNKFNNFLNTATGKIQIATLFEIAKSHGFNYKKTSRQHKPTPKKPFYETLLEQFDFDDNRDPNEPIGYRLNKFNAIEKELDGLQNGYYHLGADSNVGKSAVMHNLALDLINSNDDLTVLFFSQDDPKINASYRMIALLGDLEIHDSKKGLAALKNDYVRATHLKQARSEYVDLLQSERLVINDIADLHKMNDLEESIREYREKTKKLVVIVDGLYNLEVEGKDTIRVENIERAQHIKRIVDTYQIPLISTGELRKKQQGSKDSEPTIDDLMESGKFGYNANVVWLLYAEKNSTPNATELKLNLDYGKNKVSGFKGKQELTFTRAKGLIEEGWSKFAIAQVELEEEEV